jgi:hypothetical protein
MRETATCASPIARAAIRRREVGRVLVGRRVKVLVTWWSSRSRGAALDLNVPRNSAKRLSVGGSAGIELHVAQRDSHFLTRNALRGKASAPIGHHEANGRELDMDCCSMYTLRDGKIAELP